MHKEYKLAQEYFEIEIYNARKLKEFGLNSYFM